MSSGDDAADPSAAEDLHLVARRSQFAEADRIIAEIDGREIAVFELDGEFHALADYCVHQGGPLCEGIRSGALTTNKEFELEYSRDGAVVSCPWHGWEFDVRTGEHLAETGYKTPTYEVVLDGEDVYVRL